METRPGWGLVGIRTWRRYTISRVLANCPNMQHGAQPLGVVRRVRSAVLSDSLHMHRERLYASLSFIHLLPSPRAVYIYGVPVRCDVLGTRTLAAVYGWTKQASARGFSLAAQGAALELVQWLRCQRMNTGSQMLPRRFLGEGLHALTSLARATRPSTEAHLMVLPRRFLKGGLAVDGRLLGAPCIETRPGWDLEEIRA